MTCALLETAPCASAILIHKLMFITGLREWFSVHPIRIPVMVNMASSSLAMGKGGKHQRKSSLCIDQANVASRNSVLMDEDWDDDDDDAHLLIIWLDAKAVLLGSI
ncbi:unnamed protein product [Microthlaspi erraticum]|uniref:Uncharacterized protein n=1 Tax=Microthlaspi erraticum TaxID=1685480 RepID=A0A6D2JSK6_9BRAS|nr:unnamed protein product [Microthlaspi erraticum]